MKLTFPPSATHLIRSFRSVLLFNIAVAGPTWGAAFDYINVKDYGAVGNGVANDTAAIQSAINAAGMTPVYLPKGVYLISSGLSMPNHNAHGGLVGDGASASVIQCTGSGYTALTTRGASGIYKDFSLITKNGRSTSLNGIYFHFYGARADIENIVVHGFNGFGMNFEAIWDSAVDNIIIEESGNSSRYAFEVSGGSDTSNHTTFNRVQVEASTILAMYIDPNSLCLTFNNVHSERTLGSPGIYTHILGGNRCTYSNARIEATSNISVLLQACTTTFTDLSCTGANVDISYGLASSSVTINNLLCDTARVTSSNLGRVILNSLQATNMVNDYGTDVQLNNAKVQNVTISGNGAALKVYDSVISGTCTAAGVNTVISRQTEWRDLPTALSVILDSCKIASPYTTQYAQTIVGNNSSFGGNVTLSNNGATFLAKGCTFTGSLNYSAGSAYGALDDTCVISGAIHSNWYGIPTAGTWVKGQRRYNPTAASGSYTGVVCSAGGTPGTWKQFGLVP